jgi:hypothetical protein
MQIWVYDALLEPGLRRMGYKMTMLRRAGWGMVIAAVTMANAAAIEWWRLKVSGLLPSACFSEGFVSRMIGELPPPSPTDQISCETLMVSS